MTSTTAPRTPPTTSTAASGISSGAPTVADVGPAVVLGANQYGKAEVRLVRVTRDSARHEIEDLTVTTQLRGEALADSYLVGDNAKVVATDTQKNTVYAFARDGVGAPEDFLTRLADHFTGEFDWITGGRFGALAHSWGRIVTDASGETSEGGVGHDHAFVRGGTETRTALVVVDGDRRWVVAGLEDLTVLKSTGSEFHGFPRDRYTTLVETDDRILATSVTARWRYTDETVEAARTPGAVDFDALYERVRAVLLATFADVHSLALQQTLYAMGRRAIEEVDAVAEVRFSMPNKHHFLVDLAPFGLDNPGEVFYAADRPYGLIDGAVIRAGVAEAPAAWDAVTPFV
ncbi:factor-independent urate hydroxylase [Luteimicrobium subarcticum]|uniref:Uricase n=1 Tax=Luteimicrobium subarcticum TaxID=620910 RepID=A0A2M8WUL2_9MICO|nr:urate oxidase [Luteimicrobium subarcticum]PJI94620.1 urate oxidase [Luteimicrobium subarcticum]